MNNYSVNTTVVTCHGAPEDGPGFSHNSELSVSVIIPTKDRAGDLAVTVESLMRQTVAFEQLIIVDQSVSEESRRSIEKTLAEAPPDRRASVELSYIRDSQISGLAAARNRGIQVARTDIWLFLDDDVDLESDFLEQIVAVYRRRQAVQGVSGIVTNYTQPKPGFRWWSRVFVCGPFHDERQAIYWRADDLRDADPIPVRWFGGGLMSFRAAYIGDLRFDENLRGVCDGEDVDFCTQLRPAAGALMIAPRARLIHKASPIGRLQDHWVRRHARANIFLFCKHWNSGLVNRICVLWLLAGYLWAVSFASLRRLSIAPWRSLILGIREGLASTGN